MRSRWAKATVRSPRHSSTIAWSSPRLASSTAGSRRSAENPAPVPMRNVPFPLAIERLRERSIAFQSRDVAEEKIIDRGRRLLDRADLGHELRRRKHLLRLQREGVVLVADHGVDVVDTILRVVRSLEIFLRSRPFVFVDRVNCFLHGGNEGAVGFWVRFAERAACRYDERRRGAAKNVIAGCDEMRAGRLYFLLVE